MAAFVTDNASRLGAALFVFIALTFLGQNGDSGQQLTVALGVVSLYIGNVDLLRVFYVLSGVCAIIDIVAIARSKFEHWVLLLALVRLFTEAASVYFGYWVGVEHGAGEPAAQYSAGAPAEGGYAEQGHSPQGGALI